VARRLLLAAGVLTLTTAGFAPLAHAATGSTVASTATHYSSSRVCSTPAKGQAGCSALRRTDAAATAGTQRMAAAMTAAGAANPAAATPSGWGPADIRSAYNLTSSSSGGRTVAIVDAYNDPTAESDLGVYRLQYGLPTCTTANGCFKKVDQTGGTSYPRTDRGWAQEISLDLDMVSATCPDCHILLVEAKSASLADLGKAVQYAATVSGVVAISNSYGGSDLSDGSYGKYYNAPGKAVTASTGDNGYGVGYPASSQYVVAVGGTSLTRAPNGGWSESAWSGAGSGCSAYNPPVALSTTDTGCSTRATADVSAVADPNTGVAVYDSTSYQGVSGWLVFGGTSASAPIVASVFALNGDTTGFPKALYTKTSGLNDVTSGSNGSCSVTQLCHARPGWDGPTGLGTPNGTAAF
jgi:subtilase family serine protease